MASQLNELQPFRGFDLIGRRPPIWLDHIRVHSMNLVVLIEVH